MFRQFKTWMAACAIALLSACGGGDDHPGTLAEEAKSRGFTALVAAADKAGLVPALSASNVQPDGVCARPTPRSAHDGHVARLHQRHRHGHGARRPDAGEDPAVPRAADEEVLQPTWWRPVRRPAQDPRSTASRTPPTTLALNTAAGVKITDEVLNEATVTTANVAASNRRDSRHRQGAGAAGRAERGADGPGSTPPSRCWSKRSLRPTWPPR